MLKYRTKTIVFQLLLFIVFASISSGIQNLLPTHWIKATLLIIGSLLLFGMLIIFPFQALYNEGIVNSQAGAIQYNKKTILSFFIGLSLLFISSFGLTAVIKVPTAQNNIITAFADKGIYYTVFTVFSMCIVQPVLEELLFRYSFMTFNKDTPKFVRQSFIFTGFLTFALLHLMAGASNIWLSSIVYLLASFSLSYIYLKTKNIWLSVLAHVLNNSVAMLIIFITSYN